MVWFSMNFLDGHNKGFMIRKLVENDGPKHIERVKFLKGKTNEK